MLNAHFSCAADRYCFAASTNRSKANVSRSPRVRRVGPTIVRDGWRPARPERVLIVRVRSQTLVKLAIFVELIAVESHAQARAFRHGDGPGFIFELAACDDVVRQMMIVRVG